MQLITEEFEKIDVGMLERTFNHLIPLYEKCVKENGAQQT